MSTAKIESLNARIAKLTAERDELIEAQANTLTADKLPAGTVVTFKQKDAEYTGTVLGVSSNPKGGTTVKVLVGSGVDARIASPFLTQVAIATAGE